MPGTNRGLTWLRVAVSAIMATSVGFATEPPKSLQACGPYDISKPTVIAFLDYAGAEAEPNSNEALADFQYYLGPIRERFGKSGFTIAECYRSEFEVLVNGKRSRFAASKFGVGYYLARPGVAPAVIRGVNTDDDLIAEMKKYFGASIVAAADSGAP